MIALALLAVVSLDAAAIAQNSATLNALGPHPFGSPRNRAAAEFVAARMKEAGLAQTTLDEFVFDGSPGVNVVASLPGRSDRLVILATHHDSRREALDIGDRSRSLSVLIELGRHASRLRPAKTWILASFDGGESKGEGLAHYLDTLGRSRDLLDGVVLLDAGATQNGETPPSVIVPACASGAAPERSAIAGKELVAAGLAGVPSTVDVSFDDPGISLLTQSFIRAFKTGCDPNAERALAAQLGVLIVTDQSYSQAFLSKRATTSAKAEPPLHDNAAVRLGEAALALMQGIDAATPLTPGSSSWLAAGRSVFSGLLVFMAGLLTLAPGLVSLRSQGVRFVARAIYSAVFSMVLFAEPEVAFFSGFLPNLLPPSAPRALLALTFVPFGLLVFGGALGFVRGQVTGTWLSVWEWTGLLGAFALLYVSPTAGRKPPAKSKRGKR